MGFGFVGVNGSGWAEENHPFWSPSYGIITQALENCVVASNVLHKGALQQLMVDLGGNRDGAVIKDNPGSLFTPSQ